MVQQIAKKECYMRLLTAMLVLLAMAGCSTDSRTPAPEPESVSGAFPAFSIANSQTAGFKPQKAVVRSVKGDVQYSSGEDWKPLRVNQELTNGAQIRTLHAATVFLSVNSTNSALELVEDTEVNLMEMMMGSNGSSARTALELRRGKILGSVRTLSSDSTFQVRGGGAILKIHGTDFDMTDEGRVQLWTGTATVTFGGKTYQLRTGEYFDPKKKKVVKQIIEFGGPPLKIEQEDFPPLPTYRPWQGLRQF
jgi:hypothetical protein